jgi:hypothetical protein
LVKITTFPYVLDYSERHPDKHVVVNYFEEPEGDFMAVVPLGYSEINEDNAAQSIA